MKKYVSDMIGEEYKKWRMGDSVIITTPTGSGKTSFVLGKLLQQAVEEDMDILYLCNRKVLSEQFRDQSKQKLINESGYAENVSNMMLEHIHVFTYQHYETRNIFPRIEYPDPENEGEKIIIPQSKVKYYIFDEAHYFLGDALFNSGTNYWFKQNLAQGISVFLTATPKLLELFLIGKHVGKDEQTDFNFSEHAERIYRTTEKKRQKYNELSRKEVDLVVDIVNKKGFIGRVEHSIPQTKVREECRKINPYAHSFNYLESMHQQLNEMGYIFYPEVNAAADYSQYDVCYFSKEEEITRVIRDKCENSNEKWLVFVDSMDKGLVMATELKAFGCDAVFLSEQRVREKRACKNTYCEIINTQQYTCQVLITTPVLDCGINIVDKKVKNVVLFQHDYTTFIQSLGRKRLHQGARVNLFIQLHGSKTIQYHCRLIEKKLDYISKFCLKDAADVTASSRHHIISTFDIEYLKDNLREEWTRGLVCKSQLNANAYCECDIREYRADREKYSNSFFPEWQFSKTAFLRLVWNLQDYYSALDDYYNTGDDFFFLKHQLHWIGKEYDKDCLLGYPQKVHEINELLEEVYMSKRLLRKGEQKELVKKLLDMLLDFPLVLTSMKNDISRYRKGEMIPKKKKLNTVFEELDMPYRIQSIRKRFIDAEREETCWVVEKSGVQ